MTAVLTLAPVEPLPENAVRAFNSVLRPIGVHVLGARGSNLVLEVFDEALAPRHDFPNELIERLNRPEAVDFWRQFTSVSYS